MPIQIKRTYGIGLPDLPPVGTGATHGELVYVYDTSNIGAGGTYKKLYIGDGANGPSSLPSAIGGQYYMERLPSDLTEEGVLIPRKVLSTNDEAVIDRIQVGNGLSVSGISTFRESVFVLGNVDVTGTINASVGSTFTDIQVSGAATIDGKVEVGVDLFAPVINANVSDLKSLTGIGATIRDIDSEFADIIDVRITSGIITDIVGTAATIVTLDVNAADVVTATIGSGIVTDIQVSGASTVVGIATFQSDVYVDGNLNVTGDIRYDEVGGRNLNITGVGTITNFNSGLATITTLDTEALDALSANITGLAVTDTVGTGATFTTLSATTSNIENANIKTGIVTGGLNVSGASTFSNSVHVTDNFKINFGDGDDLQIYHSPSAGSIIQDIGPGNLSIFGSNEVIIGNQNGAETKAKFITDGAAELYYDNVKKVETSSAGIDVTGTTETDQLNVSGVSTVVGVASFQSDVYVAGDLNVTGDIVYDEVSGRNLNITGIATFNDVVTTGVASITTIDANTIDTLDAKIVTGVITSLTGTYATITDTLTVGTAITFRSGIVSATTLTGEIVRVDTAIYDSNNNVGAANSILTVNTSGKLIWQNPQDAGISTSFVTGNTYFVSANGSDSNEGNTLERPWKTVKYALSQITDIGENDVLNIASGVFEEEFPLNIPVGLTVKGAGLRATKIMPTFATRQEDCFLMNDRTVVEDMTIGGLYFDTSNNKGFAFKYAPGIAITTRSPYVQRVTVLNFGSNITADDPYGYDSADSPPSSYIAGGGAYIDGSQCTSDSLEAAFLFNECTFIVPNSKGIEMTNGARVEFLNCFSYFASIGIAGTSGSVGFASTGKTRLKATGITTTIGVGDTVTYFDTDGITGLATGIVASADSGYFRIQGKSTGFEVLPNRTAQTVTFNGNASISTAFPKFGTGALVLDGTNDSISAETAGGFGFGTGDFTVEFFIRPDVLSDKKTLFDLRDGSGTDTALNIISIGNSIGLQVGTTTAILGNTGLSTETYYHVSVARSDTETKLFINGTQEGSTYSDSNDYGSTKPMVLGAQYDGTTDAFQGYIDELRVEKGVSKYRSNFTAPTQALLGDRDTSILLHFDGATGVTTAPDDVIVNQDIRITQDGGIGTATKFTLADFSQFGADMRSVGCAVEYGQQGVVADGDGVALRLFAINFNFVGAGKDFTNDPNLAIQANEVTETNNGEVSYVSIDHKGDFRVGEAFFVDQENGTVSFTNQVTSLQALSSLTITDGVDSSVITPTSGQFGNITIAGNNIESTAGDINIDPAGSGDVNITGNVNIAGILTAQVVQIDAFQKGDTSIALDDSGSDGTIRFNTDGTEGMRLTNAQRLGIGTPSPRAKLDVIGQTLVEDIDITGIGTIQTLDASLGEFTNLYVNAGFATNFTFSGATIFQDDVFLGDNDVLRFGTGQDLQIYHDGTDTHIKNISPNELKIYGQTIRFQNSAADEQFALFTDDGSVDLYYDNVKKFETSTHGVTITGGTLVSAASTFSTDLHVVGSIRATNLHSNGGDLVIRGGGNTSTRAGFVLPNSTSADVQINGPSSGSSDIVIDTRGTGEVVIKASGSQKFATTAFGIDITGHTETDTLQVSGITTAANIEIGSASNNTINSKTGALTLDSEVGNNVAIGTHVNIVGFLSATDGIYYDSGDYNGPNGIAFFNDDGLIVSSGATTSGLTTSNYLLTTNASGVPVWTDVFDGGSF